jgi:SAM-dependent methyltransferase
MSKKDFYRAFEDRYRGSRELIRGRLEVYLDFLRPLAGLFKNPSAVDLGCGRGEFLEVLLAAGFKPKGVDLDAGMLKACEELHLPAEKADALAFLGKLPKQSQVVVSAFHVVEHISFEELQTLVSEAYRVLKPGGIMILETPNPENITVATASFYLDPTHERPIPPPLLSFIGEYAGFERVKILRLQESPELREKIDVNLADVLGGVSPDYSIVAQKAGSKKTISALNQAFAKHYGLTSSDLANRYEDSHQRALEEINQVKAATENTLNAVSEVIQTELAEVHLRLEQAVGELGAARAARAALGAEREAIKVELAEARGRLEQASIIAQELSQERDALLSEKETTASLLQGANEKLAATHQELHQIHQANHHHHQLAQERQQRIDELLRSTCWRLTAPLRWVRRVFTPTTHKESKESLADTLLTHSALYIRRRPYLKQRALGVLFRYPALHSRVMPVLHKIHSAGVHTDQTSRKSLSISSNVFAPDTVGKLIDDLTPQARRIYERLRSMRGSAF